MCAQPFYASCDDSSSAGDDMSNNTQTGRPVLNFLSPHPED
jgi:hypothetical protein